VKPHIFHRLIALALALAGGAAGVPRAAAGQDGPPPAVVEQLNRLGANLFSAAPRPADAIEELKAILAADPGLAEAHLLLGIAYRAEGSTARLGEAVAELRQAIALKPSLLMARLTLARVYLDMARGSRAREELESALEEAPGRPEILSLLGEAERQLGNPRRSADLNREALEADAAFVQARYYLGLALLDLRQHADAIRELQRVAQSGANPVEANLALGTAFLAAGRPADALPPLQEAVRLAPANPEIHLRLARAFRTSRSFARADQELTLAKRHREAALGALYHDLESELHLEEGLLRLAQGQLKAASAAFQRVLALNAKHEAARQGLAEVRKRLQQRAPSRKPGGSS
jgi:Tfp pilus assembly protein PilF